MAAFAVLQGRRVEPVRTRLVVAENLLPALQEGRWLAGTERVNFGTTLGRRYHEARASDAPPAAPGLLEAHDDVQGDFAWVVGREAVFEVEVLEPAERVLLLRAAALQDCENELSVLFAGQELGTLRLRLGRWLTYRLEVPAALQRRGTQRVLLRFARTCAEGAGAPPPPPGLEVAARLRQARLLTPDQERALEAGDPSRCPQGGGLAVVQRDGRSVLRLRMVPGQAVQLARELPEGRVAFSFLVEALPAPLEVSLAADDVYRRTVLSLPAGPEGPREVRVDASAWAGRVVVLELHALPSAGAAGEVVLGPIGLLVPGEPDAAGDGGEALPAEEDADPASLTLDEGGAEEAGAGGLAAGARPLPPLAWDGAGHRLLLDPATRQRRLLVLDPASGAPRGTGTGDDVIRERPVTALLLQQQLTRALTEAARRVAGAAGEGLTLEELLASGRLRVGPDAMPGAGRRAAPGGSPGATAARDGSDDGAAPLPLDALVDALRLMLHRHRW